MTNQQELIGSKLLKDEYFKLLQDTQDITQWIEELINKLYQLTKTNEELTKLNNVLKLVFQE
ncbi:22361_t:CDS:2, partial [Gigaspora margarita]